MGSLTQSRLNAASVALLLHELEVCPGRCLLPLGLSCYNLVSIGQSVHSCVHVLPGLDQLPIGQVMEPQMHSSLALGELVPVPAEPTGALRIEDFPGSVSCEHAGLSDVGEVQRAQTAAGLRLQALQSVLRRCQIVRAALDLASIGGHSCAPDGRQLAILQRRGARLCPAIELGAGLLSVAQTLEQLERKAGKCAVALPLRDLLQGRCAALCALLIGAGKQVRQ